MGTKNMLAGMLIMSALQMHCQRHRHAPEVFWSAPDTSTIPATEEGRQIRYGRELIANTAYYTGPAGKAGNFSNSMNCQNCHLAAGTVPWGNNYSAAWATYPKYRDRSGSVESLEKKINDCIERSLNGRPIDSNSREMRAMIAYMRWLGQNVPKGSKPPGSGIRELPLPPTAADTAKGRIVFMHKCMQCHGADGAGKSAALTPGYQYPPLWGNGSFNTGAGIFRLTKMAGYVKYNMPQGSTFNNPQLSDEDAWNVAAFIISQPRPQKEFPGDWPDIRTKPADHPFGPFADTFPAAQHKYGPFGPIKRFMLYQKQ